MNDQTAEMVRLYNEGRTMAEIAKIIGGVTRQRVQQIVSPLVETRTTELRMAARKTSLRNAWRRIETGESTREEEARRLGYKHGVSLLEAFRSIGIKQPDPEPKHGTMHRYNKLKCRCPECRQAAKDEREARKARGPKKHGTASGYKNFGCRCPRCRRANTRYERKRRIARRNQKGAQA